MATTPHAPRGRQVTLRGLMLTVLALAIPCGALFTEGPQSMGLGLLSLLVGPFLLARFGLWLFPVEP